MAEPVGNDPQGARPVLDAGPPPDPDHVAPDVLEAYVRAAMHSDRSPGDVLAVVHPLRMTKVPRGLFEVLGGVGFRVTVVETHPDRVQSVRRIRDALLDRDDPSRALDVLVISGDGSLDHHVLVAAFWAFYPELVEERPGAIDFSAVTVDDLAALPAPYRALLDPLPSADGIEPTDENVHAVWRVRGEIGAAAARGASVRRLQRKAGDVSDRLFRVALLSTLLPHRVVLRGRGFDLSGVARATKEQTFAGLYPFIRSIAMYPAGTAADNALYAGVPGWPYAQASRVLTRFPMLAGIRRSWEDRARQRFLRYFVRESTVVPARFSLVAFDGDWQAISSHAVGGPGGGHFFSADLGKKTRGLAGYLARIPRVLVAEGLLGSTVVRIEARTPSGETKVSTQAQLAEGLYTNRAFIAGVGSVPSTDPTSFAGQSSLVVAPPLWGRDEYGFRRLALRGLFTFVEAIVKGVLGRALHLLGFSVGRLAGGGKFVSAAPQHQIAVKEGEEVEITYLDNDGNPKWVPAQVSGDPYQATRITIRVAWGPLPLLAHERSLLLASATRTLQQLRDAMTWKLRSTHIGGLHYFRHLVGPEWTRRLSAETGLFQPPEVLPRQLDRAQQELIRRWQALGTGAFVDTSERGLQLGRRGRYAHNNDHTAHLVLLRDRQGTLVVRQVRADPATFVIHENRTLYRASGLAWIVQEGQTRRHDPGEIPKIVREVHYFRSADAFRTEAPVFFPFITRGDDLGLPDVTEEATLPPETARRG